MLSGWQSLKELLPRQATTFASLGLSSFKFSVLSSVCPRKLTAARWDITRSAQEERATPNETIPARQLTPALLAPSALKRGDRSPS
jgi:hypothetical protein